LVDRGDHDGQGIGYCRSGDIGHSPKGSGRDRSGYCCWWRTWQRVRKHLNHWRLRQQEWQDMQGLRKGRVLQCKRLLWQLVRPLRRWLPELFRGVQLAQALSTDGACGSKNGRICKGFAKGECCSSSGYCGASSGHCGAGCQNAFGVCNGGSAAISTDRNCSKNGKTCKGSTYGDCCSVANYCGKSSTHCGSGW
jgi:hypothetical protein